MVAKQELLPMTNFSEWLSKGKKTSLKKIKFLPNLKSFNKAESEGFRVTLETKHKNLELWQSGRGQKFLCQRNWITRLRLSAKFSGQRLTGDELPSKTRNLGRKNDNQRLKNDDSLAGLFVKTEGMGRERMGCDSFRGVFWRWFFSLGGLSNFTLFTYFWHRAGTSS